MTAVPGTCFLLGTGGKPVPGNDFLLGIGGKVVTRNPRRLGTPLLRSSLPAPTLRMVPSSLGIGVTGNRWPAAIQRACLVD